MRDITFLPLTVSPMCVRQLWRKYEWIVIHSRSVICHLVFLGKRERPFARNQHQGKNFCPFWQLLSDNLTVFHNCHFSIELFPLSSPGNYTAEREKDCHLQLSEKEKRQEPTIKGRETWLPDNLAWNWVRQYKERETINNTDKQQHSADTLNHSTNTTKPYSPRPLLPFSHWLFS